MNNVEQLSEVLLLIDFLCGVACGLFGSTVHGSRHEDRERGMLRTAPDAVCAGARVMHGLYTRDDGYLQSLLSGGRRATWNRGRPGPSGPHGKRSHR